MYKIGRRFEYHVVYKLKKFGLNAYRVPLSGRSKIPSSKILPNADIIVENKYGKLKKSNRKYVIFPKREFEELINNQVHFLCFAFHRTNPYFIIKSKKDYTEKIYKEFSDYISLNKNIIEKIPLNLFLNEYKFDIIDIESFVKIIKEL